MPRILIILISLGLSAILGVVFLWPKYQELNHLQIKIKNTELDINYHNEYYKELAALSEKLEKDYKEETQKINSALPSSPPLPSLLKFFQNTASGNGLILITASFSAKPPLTGDDIKEIQGSLNLAGSYPALKSFLRVLEKSARLIEIERVSFSSLPSLLILKAEAGSSDIFNFQLSIKTKSY